MEGHEDHSLKGVSRGRADWMDARGIFLSLADSPESSIGHGLATLIMKINSSDVGKVIGIL